MLEIMGSRKIRNALSASLLGLALIPWLPWSCQTRPSAPPAPPPPNYFDLGEKYFDAGDYAKAAEAYSLYLQGNPTAGNQDRAMFRLALAYALPASPVRDLPHATETLQGLVQRFPQSPYAPQAAFLLELQTETDQLRAEVQQLQQVQVEIEARQGEIEKLRADVSKREERIRQLTEELDKLKQIDMQRRPSSLPP